MKKFLIVVSAAFFCLAFAMPAMAGIKAGGMITTDFYYYDESSESAADGVVQGSSTLHNGVSETQINLPQPYNRFNVRFNTDDNVLIGFIELRQGKPDMEKEAGLIWNYGYLWWTLNPTWRFQIGRQTQPYSIGNPALSLGANAGHNLAGGFQYVGAASVDAFRAHIRFSDNARMEIALLDPRNNNGEIISGFSGVTAGTPNEESVIPEIQIAVPLTFGNFYLEPSALWQTIDYDQVLGGNEDSIDRWGLCLLFKWGFGMMTLSGEFALQQNVATGGIGATRYQTSATPTWAIQDTDEMFGWLNLGIKFGAATLNLAAGGIKIENDGSPAANDEVDITKMFYGASLPISVAKGFTVRPEFTYYDFDSGALNGSDNPLTEDNGSDMVLGVQFQLVF